MTSQNKLPVVKFVAVCHLGCMEKARGGATTNKPLQLTESYIDSEPCWKVAKNHYLFSPKHSFESEEDVDLWLAQNQTEWLKESVEDWDHDKFDRWFAAADEHNGPSKPAGQPCNTKGEPASEPAVNDVSRALADQVAAQTANMLHFSRTATRLIDALTCAEEMSLKAADVFRRQRLQMEIGCDEMTIAFGLQNQQRHFSSGDEQRRGSQSSGCGSGLQRLQIFPAKLAPPARPRSRSRRRRL